MEQLQAVAARFDRGEGVGSACARLLAAGAKPGWYVTLCGDRAVAEPSPGRGLAWGRLASPPPALDSHRLIDHHPPAHPAGEIPPAGGG